MISKIQKLEKELRKAKKAESERLWKESFDTIASFFEVHQYNDLCYVNIGKDKLKSLTIYRINGTSIDNYYADRQGFYGQWTTKRFIEIYCTALTIGSKYYPSKLATYFSTGETGSTMGDEFIFPERVELAYEFTTGFPIGPKVSWKDEYKRIIETGNLNVSTAGFVFGNKAINENDGHTKILDNFNNFKMNMRIAPKGLFDRVMGIYIKQCKESYELFEDINSNPYNFKFESIKEYDKNNL